MKSYNVLILSAGRRVELIKCFKKARERLGIDSTIIAVDISDTAPAIYFADKYYLIPRIGDPKYIDSLINVCNSENIALIIPTIDTELLALMENRAEIENKTNAKILLSRDEVITICRNKNNTIQFFEKYGFGVPRQITQLDLEKQNYSFPLFIKPRDGSSSINTFKVNCKEELEFFNKYVNNPIIQEFILGKEYSIDVFCDFESNPITIVPRLRMATRSGEISKGMIDKDREIIDEVKRLVDIMKPIGHITVQCMKTQKGIKYIEINPRFGGGAPMSIDAGADSCENLYRLLSGEKLNYNEDYEDKAVFVRFDDSIKLDRNVEI